VARDNDVPGVAPLASGATATAQVTALLNKLGGVALVNAGAISGPGIVTDLGMTWTSDR
jgi:predicted dinucleotide-binding enzyme